jgi:hypothetical protein
MGQRFAHPRTGHYARSGPLWLVRLALFLWEGSGAGRSQSDVQVGSMVWSTTARSSSDSASRSSCWRRRVANPGWWPRHRSGAG